MTSPAAASDHQTDKVSSKYSTPVLVKNDNTLICDSRAIVRFASDTYSNPGTNLFPNSEVSVLQDEYHDQLGPHTRRIAYDFGFREPSVMFELAANNASVAEARMFKILFPIGKAMLKRRLNISDESVLRSREKVIAVFDSVAERLKEQPFLAGERFTAADMSFACMAAPVLVVQPEDGYGAWLPRVDDCPPDLRDYAKMMRRHPAGAYALKIYREHRPRK